MIEASSERAVANYQPKKPNRTFKACSIEGCTKPQHAKTWCSAHFQRFKRHGDPLGGGPTHGFTASFIYDVALGFSEKDRCLTWPHGRSSNGYGKCNIGGKKNNAHRVVCELAHGPAPSAEHQACHTCGKGHEGCVNPHHLRWGTPAQNQNDRRDHGTHHRGETVSGAVLSVDDVRAIRSAEAIEPVDLLASRFGVSKSTIRDVQQRKSWAWLDPIRTLPNGMTCGVIGGEGWEAAPAKDAGEPT